MRHAQSTPLPLEETSLEAAPVVRWHVYNASRVLVATYSTQEAAASHVACWPALYYQEGAASLAAPGGSSVPS